MLPIENRGGTCVFYPERIQDICVFCDEFDVSKGTGLFYELFPELAEEKQVLDETPHHVLLPDIGPLTQDHLLVVSKEHVPSFASLPANQHEDYQFLADSVVSRMSGLHPEMQPVVFEHGVGTVNGQFIRCGGCGRTDHAHLHLLPVAREKHHNLLESFSAHNRNKLGFEEHTLTNPFAAGELKSIVGDRPYLLIGDRQAGRVYIQNDTLEIPSQYIRTFLGNHLGIKNHNWKVMLAESPEVAETRIKITLKQWKNR